MVICKFSFEFLKRGILWNSYEWVLYLKH
jgi:hypothetical protein